MYAYPTAMHELLSQIEDLLRRHECVYEANGVELARLKLDNDPGHFWSLLDSDDWWGGPDSISSVDLAVRSGFSSQGREDSRELRRLLTEVHDAMLAQGLNNPHASIIVAEFRKWAASRI